MSLPWILLCIFLYCLIGTILAIIFLALCEEEKLGLTTRDQKLAWWALVWPLVIVVGSVMFLVFLGFVVADFIEDPIGPFLKRCLRAPINGVRYLIREADNPKENV